MLHVLTLDNPHKEINIRQRGLLHTPTKGRRRDRPRLLSPLVFLATPLTRQMYGIRDGSAPLSSGCMEELNPIDAADLLLRMPAPRRNPGAGLAADAFCLRESAPGSETMFRRRRAGTPARYVTAVSTAITPSMWRCIALAEVSALIVTGLLSFDITITRRLNQHLRAGDRADYFGRLPACGHRPRRRRPTNAEVREHSQHSSSNNTE